MGRVSVGNNTTLYDGDYLGLPNANPEVMIRPEFEIWPVETCLRFLIINLTDTSNLVERTFFYNETALRCWEHSPVIKNGTLKAIVLAVIAVLSFLLNAAKIISVKRDKRSRGGAKSSWTAIYVLTFQLSIADLLVTVFCMGGEAAWTWTVQWYAGDVGCKLFKFLQMFSLYLSTFILVLIGIDRWLAVKYPMKRKATATRNGRLVILAWIMSFILSIPQAIVFREAKGPFVEEFYQCVTHGFYTERWQEQAYTTLSLIFMFIIPLVILVSTYVSTYRAIAHSDKVFKLEEMYLSPDMNRTRLIDRAKLKSLKMSVVTVATFLIWWTPYYVMMVLFIFFDPDKNLSEDLRSGIFFFGMSNSLVNPVIYGAFHLWPQKKPSHRHSDRESGGRQPSLLRRGSSVSLLQLTTIRSAMYSYSNGQNVSLFELQTRTNNHTSVIEEEMC